MVGFKSIALLLSLLIFAACVPQTKQTECGSNEAFNAALRTCVPVVNGPSSFISIDSFLPTTSLTKYKNDTTPMTFSVVIDNPYAQTYTVQWERIYNGVPVGITPDTAVSYSFAPSLLSTEIGIHIISVKVKDTSNNIVDSHNFQLVINETPQPVIQSATVTPALYASAYTPVSLDQNFQFTIYNNGAITLGAGYRTDWKLYQNGVLIDSETDTFTSTSTTGYNYPVYLFEPDTLGVGNYVIIARVTNTAAVVVAEQQWSATVSHPALSKVTNRDIYSSTTSPTFSAVTTAYDSVAYTASTSYNFIPAGGVAQGDYCVSVVSGEGTYAGDSLFVRVDYYLDGGTAIYSGLTTAVDNKICLTDAAAATLNGVIFSNTTSTTTQTHTLVARVTDEATGSEYTLTDMNGSLGSYPITWNFSVKPQNQAPTVAFGTITGLTCPTTVGNTKSGCTTDSDFNFTVTINLSSDDFYTVPADEANFNYSIRLYRDGVNIQTCTKAGYSVVDPFLLNAADANGADGYECELRINSYTGSGPLDLDTHTYQIQAEITDNGSPITGTDMTSSTLTWSFAASGVTETNTAPTIGLTWSVGGTATEASIALPITFAVDITDAERDNHTYAIKYCTDGIACTTSATLTSGTVTRTTSTNPYSLSVSHVLAEDFLFNLTGGDAIMRNQFLTGYFFIVIDDVPDTAIPLTVTSGTGPSDITNYNPAPTLNTAFSTPAPATFTALTTFAFVGHPMSITNVPASILTDTSTIVAEETFRYQWFVKNSTSVTTYTAIDGATSVNLVWTPSHIDELTIGTDNPLSFMLCVEDHPAAAVTSPNETDSTCSDATPWVVTVKNNLGIAHDMSNVPTATELATAAGEDGNETAIWYDTPSTFNSVTSSAAYIAMFGNDQEIHIKKVLVRDRGGIDTIDATQVVSFYAVPTGTVDTVKDLSITGTTDASGGVDLYVAYLASRTGSPGSFYPQVRRIDLRDTTAKLAPNNHAGKFGFDYDGLTITEACSLPGECTVINNTDNTQITFSPTGGTITGNFTLETPNGNFVVDFGTSDGIDTICDICTGATMATQLETIINTSTDPLLAGYSADRVGAQITINGASSLDYFDASSDTNSRIADRMGKIYVSGLSWYLPFINTSLGGGYNDKLSVYTSTTGVHMNAAVEGILEPAATPGLASMEAASKFDNYLDSVTGVLWIGMVTKTGSAGKLYKVDPATYALADTDTLFSGDSLVDIQLAASTTNVFVGVTAFLGNELKLGVYDNNGTLLDEFDMDDPTNLDPLSNTDDIFTTAAISSFRIVPYGTEARIFAASQGTPATTYKLYVARLRSVSSVWTLSCGDCQTISEASVDYNLSQYVSLGVAPIIRDNPSALYRLSTDGAIPNQGIKDVAFVSYGRTDVALATTCDPAIGVFNMEGEAIGSTIIFDGTGAIPVAQHDAGLFRPPFIKN